jgi:hypothetical protein
MSRILLVALVAPADLEKIEAALSDASRSKAKLVEDDLVLDRARLGTAAAGLGRKLADEFEPA